MRARILLCCAALVACCATSLAGGAQTPVTLYFHAGAPASDIDEALAFQGVGNGPEMTADAPGAGQAKVATALPAGSTGFRKNFLGAWWASSFDGVVSAPEVRFWAFTTAAITVDVTLFRNGPGGITPPVAVQSVAALDGLSQYRVTFPSLSFATTGGVVVQIFATTEGGQSAPLAVLFDSADYPSRMSFTLG